MRPLAQGKRLIGRVRDTIVRDIEEYGLGILMQLSDTGEPDYQDLINTLRARKGASMTE
jgi:hypothetical protein